MRKRCEVLAAELVGLRSIAGAARLSVVASRVSDLHNLLSIN